VLKLAEREIRLPATSGDWQISARGLLSP